MKWFSRFLDFLGAPGVSGAVAGFVTTILCIAVLIPLSGQTQAPEVIRALAVLSWPAVALIVAYWLRDDLKDVLSRLRKGKFPGGGEFELDSGTKEPPPTEKDPGARSAMEYKILKTLFTKQVNRFPNYDGVWYFRVNWPSPEFLSFREASIKLIGGGLIGETNEGQLFLTRAGFEYCKQHYKAFPNDEWWPEEKENPEQLRKALEAQ